MSNVTTQEINKENKLTLGSFIQEFTKKSKGKPFDKSIITKAVTGISEDGNGAALVTYDIVREFLAATQQGSVLYKKAKKISSPKFGIKIPYVTETARDNDRSTGLRAFFVGEGEQKTISKVQWDSRSIKLQKLCVEIPVTLELMEDVQSLDSALLAFATDTLSWYIDYAMIYGTSRIEGIFSGSNPGGVISATSADPLTVTVLQNFEKALSPAVSKNAEWYFSKENWNDIVDLILDASTNRWITFGNDGSAYIFGHKVNVLEQLSGDEGIILGDF